MLDQRLNDVLTPVKVCRCGHSRSEHGKNFHGCTHDIQAGVRCVCKDYDQRETIICLCGSTRFKQTFIDWNKRLTCEGFIVLSVGFFGHQEVVAIGDDLKVKLDALHKRKIELSDGILVLDVGGYIGSSTAGEIDHAVTHGKDIIRLTDFWPDYQEPTEAQLKMDPTRPDFVVKAYDALATSVVRNWIDRAIGAGVSKAKIVRALDHHDAIREWQLNHQNQVKLPD
jgi:hypothetical protein